MSELWHCLILLGVLEVFWFYATLIIFVDNNNNNNNNKQILVVIFDLLDVCSSQFGMITIADW